MPRIALHRRASRAMSAMPASAAVSRQPTLQHSAIRKQPTLHRRKNKRLQRRLQLDAKNSFIHDELAKLTALSDHRAEKARKKNLSKTLGAALALLPDLAEALPPTPHNLPEPSQQSTEPATKHLSHRAWRSAVQEERHQLQRVHSHQAFVSMGVDALRTHLSNTVCADPSKPPPPVPTSKPQREAHSRLNASHKSTTHGDLNRSQRPRRDDQVMERAAKRRDYKRDMAERAARYKSKHPAPIHSNKLPSEKSRGRIGEKRPKLLD